MGTTPPHIRSYLEINVTQPAFRADAYARPPERPSKARDWWEPGGFTIDTAWSANEEIAMRRVASELASHAPSQLTGIGVWIDQGERFRNLVPWETYTEPEPSAATPPIGSRDCSHQGAVWYPRSV